RHNQRRRKPTQRTLSRFLRADERVELNLAVLFSREVSARIGRPIDEEKLDRPKHAPVCAVDLRQVSRKKSQIQKTENRKHQLFEMRIELLGMPARGKEKIRRIREETENQQLIFAANQKRSNRDEPCRKEQYVALFLMVRKPVNHSREFVGHREREHGRDQKDSDRSAPNDEGQEQRDSNHSRRDSSGELGRKLVGRGSGHRVRHCFCHSTTSAGGMSPAVMLPAPTPPKRR